ncbi:hypothetical protein ANN_26349 [Periplaneta americana]|uniref:DUF4817 domain-containing protein n=1 Tax=Periplaneta americana TaxID=6978 RepID=A0ABQ8S5N9_PERAM|nr:hypothetical protein ANN_26349 [Periplaneta americana]
MRRQRGRQKIGKIERMLGLQCKTFPWAEHYERLNDCNSGKDRMRRCPMSHNVVATLLRTIKNFDNMSFRNYLLLSTIRACRPIASLLFYRAGREGVLGIGHDGPCCCGIDFCASPRSFITGPKSYYEPNGESTVHSTTTSYELPHINGVQVRSLPSKETLRGHSDSSFRGEGYIQCCIGVRLCDMYSNQELAEIHFMYGKADGNAALVRRLYQERYPQRQCPDRKTFVRLHYRLCEYGKFNSPGLGRGRPRSTTPEVQEEILEPVNMTPYISTRRVALQVNVPHTTVWRLLKEYQLLYPYHLQRVPGPVTSRLPCTS